MIQFKANYLAKIQRLSGINEPWRCCTEILDDEWTSSVETFPTRKMNAKMHQHRTMKTYFINGPSFRCSQIFPCTVVNLLIWPMSALAVEKFTFRKLVWTWFSEDEITACVWVTEWERESVNVCPESDAMGFCVFWHTSASNLIYFRWIWTSASSSSTMVAPRCITAPATITTFKTLCNWTTSNSAHTKRQTINSVFT